MDFYYHDLDNGLLVLTADGGLNAETAGQFVTDLEKLVDGGIHKIIVDCTHLEYISSFGISVLLRLHRNLKKHGGDVKLANIHSRLLSLLAITRVDGFFQIYPDVDRARLAFRPKDPPEAK